MDAETLERNRARRFGFAALLGWACLGFALEAAHGLKLASYLDHPLRRELLTLAHAHGVGLSLVVLAYAATGIVDASSSAHGKRLRLGALLVPLGFLLSIAGAGESDPGPAIFTVPLGALLVLYALFGILRSQPRP
jgi:hypothetical protein